MDTIRVLRLVEYIGPRADIERQIESSIHGSRSFLAEHGTVTIRATTLGQFPEIMEQPRDNNKNEEVPGSYPQAEGSEADWP